jgi:hypothetical protein
MIGPLFPASANGVAPKSARTPWTVWALMAIHCLGAANASFNIDTVRDVAYALDIADGSKWHLSGPEIGFSFRLGPLWFYWLALPLSLGLPIGFLSWFTAATSSLQYWFAWRLGAAILDRRLGLCFALALALPAWKQMYWLAGTHTILTIPAALAAMLSWTGYWKTPSRALAFVAGLAIGVALHGHPSVLPLGLLVFLPLLRRRDASAWVDASLAIVGCGLLFVPPLIEQAASGWPDVERTARFVSGQHWLANVAHVPYVLWGIAASGAPAGAEIALSRHPVLEASVTAITRLALILGAAGLFRAARSRRLRVFISIAAVLAALNVLIVTASRDYVTYYSVDLAATLLSLIVGAGWHAIGDGFGHGHARGLPVAGTALVVLGSLSMAAASTERARAGTVVAPIVAGLNLQRGGALDATRVQPALFSRDLAPLEQHACAVPQPVVHGDGAIFEDLVSDVLGRAACNRPKLMQLGGRARPGTPDIAGVPCAIVEGGSEQRQAENRLCWIPVSRNLNRGAGLTAADSRMYLPHRYQSGVKTLTYTDAIAPEEIVVLTITQPDWVEYGMPKMTIGGVNATPFYSNGRTFAWKANPSASGAEPFTVTLAAAQPEAVDIFAIDRPGDL